MSVDPNLPKVSPMPFVLLAMLTVAVMAGPVLIAVAVRGGPSAEWPPDRLGEWLVFSAVCAFVAALLFATLVAALWHKRDWQNRMERYRREHEQSGNPPL